MISDNNLPDPEFRETDKYIAALSAFQGSDFELGPGDVEMFAGEDLEDQLEDLTRFGVLTSYERGEKKLYRPKDEYAIRLSGNCDDAIFENYKNVRNFLNENDGDDLLEEIQ